MIARVLTAMLGSFLLGGLVHLGAIDDAARAAIAAGGVSLFSWNGKYVSELNAVMTIFCGLLLLAWVGLVGIYGVIVGLEMRRCRRAPRFGRALIIELWWIGIAAALGTLVAISFNQWIMTATYRDEASPGSYLATTIGFGLPAMQTLTAAWQRSLLIFLVLLGVAGTVARWSGATWEGRRRVYKG